MHRGPHQIGDSQVEDLTKEQMQADIDFLLSRSMKAGSTFFTEERDVGESSNSLVCLAYSQITLVKGPGDMSDLRACELAYKRLPEHRKTARVSEALEWQRQAVHERFSTENG